MQFILKRLPVAAALVLVATGCGSEPPRGGESAPTPEKTADAQSPPSVSSSEPSPDPVPDPVTAQDYDPSRFTDSAAVDHRWYPLEPGTLLEYRGSSLDEGERLHHTVTIIVTDLTKMVDGVENVVVWERDYTEGELEETELALFAQDTDGNVWHMGEYPEEFEEGEFAAAPTWVHGIKGAYAGITIPAHPTEGTPGYEQGYAPPPINWVDRGRVYKTGQQTCVPADCYEDVVIIEEFEPNIPGAFQDKYYAPGVGVVRVGWRGRNDESKEVLELVEVRRLDASEMEDVRAEALALEERAYRSSKDVWGRTPPSKASTG